MSQSLNSGSNGAPARKPVVILLVLVLVAGVAVAYFLHKPPAPAVATSESEPKTAAAEPVEKTDSPPAQNPQPTPPRPTATASATASVAPAPALDPNVSPFARQIVTALAQMSLTNGPMTPEKQLAWRSTLQQLTNQGPAALPAIREFLKSGKDINFDSI